MMRLTGITKRFGSVTVLRDVQFEARAGEVHILAGENGAGKSTLIKILAALRIWGRNGERFPQTRSRSESLNRRTRLTPLASTHLWRRGQHRKRCIPSVVLFWG